MDSIGKIYKQMLTEATGDDVNRVAKQHPDVDRETIQKYADEADPKQGKSSRYIDWLVKGHKAGSHAPEDTFRLHAALNNFEKYKPKLEKKDINQYKHVSELEDAVEPHLGVMSARAEGDAKTYWGKPEHHEKIFDNGNGLQVFHTKSKEASKAIYGGGHSAGGCHTSWCTAGRSDQNRFDHYSKDSKNPLYQIHTPDGKVYQDEFSGDYSGGLRNARDESVKREDLVKENPDLTKVPAFQGKDISYTGPGPKLDELLHNEIKKGKYSVALKHPDAKVEHLHAILDNDMYGDSRDAVLDHHKTDASVLSRVSDYENHSKETSNKLFNHPAFGEEHIQKILGHESYGSTKSNLFDSGKLNRSHIDQAINSGNESSITHALRHPLATDEDRVKILEKGKNRSNAMSTMQSPDLIEKHYTNADSYSATANPNTPSSIISKIYDSAKHGGYDKRSAAMHRNAPPEVLSDMIKNGPYEHAKELLDTHQGITQDHVKDAFNNSHMLLKQAALRHPKAPEEIHDSAISNPSFHGSISVSTSAKPEHLDTLSGSKHDFIRENVAKNKNTSKDTLTKLSSDENSDVASAAAKQLKKRK
jgi:hypothetical protein